MDAQQHFVQFVSETNEPLFRTALLLTGNAGEAEELLQDVLVRLYPKWDKVVTAQSPIAYVRRSLVNRFLSQRRAPATTRMHAAPFADFAVTTDAVEQVLDRGVIADLLLRLAPRQRAAIVLRYLHDLSDPDIAAVIGCRTATVRSLISRGIDSMRSEAEHRVSLPADRNVRPSDA